MAKRTRFARLDRIKEAWDRAFIAEKVARRLYERECDRLAR